MARAVLLVVIAASLVAGFLATDSGASAQAVAASGPDLTRLLRAMAAIKVGFAAAASAVVLWRMASPMGSAWFALYLLACGAMAAGPGLIWDMARVGSGALLLHAGLLAAIVLLWRDPGVSERLKAVVASRRARRPSPAR
jgi:hypothetical protein